MGFGIYLKCETCGYKADIYDDYGGLYYYYTYRCNSCGKFFTKTDNELLVDKMRHKSAVSCEYCSKETSESVHTFEVMSKFKEEKIGEPGPYKCPECKDILRYDGYFMFDD